IVTLTGSPRLFRDMEYPSLAHKLPRKSARNRNRMSRQNADLSQCPRRFVENAELSQHRPPVVVDCFSSQTTVGVEGVATPVCLPIAHLSGITAADPRLR